MVSVRALVGATKARFYHDAAQAGPIPTRPATLVSLHKTTKKARPQRVFVREISGACDDARVF